MPDFTKRVARRISQTLLPGETILKALVAQPPGSMTRGINETGDVAGSVLRGRSRKRRHGEGAVGLAAAIPPRNVFLTLTDRRLVVHTATVTGQPDEMVTEFGFDRIAEVGLRRGRFGSGMIDLAFVDESTVDFLIASRQRPEEFVDAWGRVSGGSSS